LKCSAIGYSLLCSHISQGFSFLSFGGHAMGIYEAIPWLWRYFWLNSNYIEKPWNEQVGTSGNAYDLYLGGA
jgi:hypothetical protein